eukprot:CAMPEP_0114470514 /NCGR_PEP_ID=MMETSP0104-20121206/11308_1 /TAXON_ID=37642 ORGANISM="Paraphysomonas imperforata, Strain PA2" /NCGR_SAMPLE_ID=MMETSP0104 /ASSEMBLY_ACC=CAM_ASM_000202 /LENGTH=330 /DNA_ID=CAMNT_0001644275 /DNA_START=203 /DNA_END=1195 /DNA_ORIENTATION=-
MALAQQMKNAVEALDFGAKEDEITSKALEYMRMMEIKVNNLKKAENARMALAIEFSCKSHHIPVPRTALMKLAGGVSQKDYIDAIQKCTNLMDLKFDNLCTIEVFGVKYSSVDTANMARELLVTYEQQQAQLNRYMQKRDYGSALYQGAAFAVAAKANKLKVMPKRDIFFKTLDLSTKSVFDKICAELEAVSRDDSIFSDQRTTTAPASAASSPSALPTSSRPSNGANDVNRMKREILHSAANIVDEDLLPMSKTKSRNSLDTEEFQRRKQIQGASKRLYSNVQFDNVKSAELREAAEREAIEKKRKSLAIYTSWKNAVLQKRSLTLQNK